MNKSYGDQIRTWAASLWTEAVGMSARQIALFALAGGVVHAVLRAVFVGDSLLRSIGMALGLPIGAVIGAYLVAPLVGLVGWLTRGSFNMRPLFIVLLAQTFVYTIVSEVFVPMAFQPVIGLPFHILVPLLMGVGTTAMTFAVLMTLISHRFAFGMVRIALVFGVSSVFGTYSKYLKPGHDAFMASVFAERDSGLAKAMDSRRYPSSILESDFKTMSKAFGDGH